jgi:hypothetical protein
MSEPESWPRKTRELHSHHFDSMIWNELRFRDDDSVIATYAKSGTTWMQQIIGQMLLGPDPELARLVEYCSFDWMKRNATRSVPLGGAFCDAGAEVFIHKGVNGRWRDVLGAAEARARRSRATY